MFTSNIVYGKADPEEHLEPLSTLGKICGLIKPRQRILDVGCGAGRLAMHLGNRGAVVTGIELNTHAVSAARKHCAKIIEGDLANPEIFCEKDFYDVVVCADVLEHLVEPDLILARLTGVLKPGGSVIISIPNIAYWHIRWRLLRGRFDYQPWGIMDRTHLRFFTRASLCELIAGAGLEIKSLDGVYSVPILSRVMKDWPSIHEWFGALFPTLFAVQWIVHAFRPTYFHGDKENLTA